MTEAAPQTAPATEAPQDTAPAGFTQEDVNKIAGNRAKEAKQTAINDLLSKAGAESVDDILAAYTERQQQAERQKTEADRAEDARKKAEAKAQQAEERYEGTLRQYAVRDALRDSGINSERLPLALKVADLSSLELDGEGNVSGVDTVVEGIREASPEWFADTEARQPRTSPSATREARPQENTYEGHMGGFLSNILSSP